MPSKVSKKTKYDPRSLFARKGERKYLNADELDRFIAEAGRQHRAEVRTFCLVMAHTGCRISEAVELTTASIDMGEGTITFRTLKQRDRERYRAVPVPDSTLDALELVHGIRKAQKSKKKPLPLWGWGRKMGWIHITAVMAAADIEGLHATPKGLRHGFGVRATQKTRNPRLVQKWLGHTSLETTTIYMDIIGQEEREAVAEMWD